MDEKNLQSFLSLSLPSFATFPVASPVLLVSSPPFPTVSAFHLPLDRSVEAVARPFLFSNSNALLSCCSLSFPILLSVPSVVVPLVVCIARQLKCR